MRIRLFLSADNVYLAVDHTGRFLVTSGWDGTVRFFLLSVEELMELARSRVTRALTPAECGQFLHRDVCP
jgi:hypothetical protein